MLALLLLIAQAAPPATDDPLPRGALARLGSPRLRHGGTIRALAFSLDGKSLASASHDRTVSVWDAATGQERLRLTGHEFDVTCLAWLSGARLASGAADGSVRIWSTTGPAAGIEVHKLTFTADSVLSLALSPSGKILAVGCDDGKAHLIDLASRDTLRTLEHGGAVTALAWSPDGAALAAAGGSDQGLTLWSAADGKARARVGGLAPVALAWSPDGKALAAWEAGDTVRLWATDGKEGRSWKARPGEDDRAFCYQLAWLDGKRLLTGLSTGEAVAFDVTTAKPELRINAHAGRVSALAVSARGLIATAGADHAIRIRSSEGRLLAGGAYLADPFQALWVAEGKAALMASSGKALVWDTTTGQARPGSRPLALASSRDGKRLVASTDGGGLVVVEAGVKKPVECRFDAKRLSPVMSDDGLTVAALAGGALIPVWDSRTGKLLRALPGHRGGALAAAFSPDGRMLITGGRDRLLRFWDTDSGKERYAARGQKANVTAVATSPDGRLLACGTGDGLVQIRAARGGLLLAEHHAHRGPVTGLAFLDGKVLVSAGADTTALAWDVSNAEKARPKLLKLTDGERQALWKELLNDDPAPAAAAQEKLALAGDAILPEVTRDVRAVDAATFKKLMTDLDSDEFDIRDRAEAHLRERAKSYEAMLRKVLASGPSLDIKKRLDRILDNLPESVHGPHLRDLRAVEVLEMIGSPAAKKHLATLAAGADGAELTVRAKAALSRLK